MVVLSPMQAEKVMVLEGGVTCLDADYVRPGLACFYLVEAAGEYAVIETGTSHSAQLLLEYMANQSIAVEQLRYVVPTHVHLDHAGGVGTLMSACPNATLLIHPRGARHMAQPQKLEESSRAVYGDEVFERLYGEILPVAEHRIEVMEDGAQFFLGERAFTVRHTRGHANHHFCVWDEATRGWFTGDMFGVCYPWWRFGSDDFVLPATTPTQFDPQAYLESLKLLDSYQPLHMYLTHYGRITYSAAKNQLLARQIDRYRELAMEYLETPEKLQDALINYGLDMLAGFDTGADVEKHREWLGFDMPLNTQGLQVWQASQTN